MDDVAFARALHVFGVVLWIGGVGFVTTVLLPALRRLPDAGQAFGHFEAFEGRFGWQARVTTLLVGGSGFYMVHAWDLWDRFCQPAFWWMHAMVLIWLLFTVALFVAEPLVVHRMLAARAALRPGRTLALVHRLHWLLLALSLMTVLGAVAGSHGG